MHNYISITGITTLDEVESVIQEFYDAGLSMDSKHKPVIGFLSSYKTINNTPTKNKRFPKHEQLKELLSCCGKRVLKAVHYNTRELDTLDEQVFKAVEGADFDLLQLNVVWPDSFQVSRIKEKYPDKGIILQVSNDSMNGFLIPEIAEKVSKYGAVDYILIDPSRGRGADFLIGHSYSVYEAIKSRCPEMKFTFAGGLCGRNVKNKVSNLAAKIMSTDFSIDAEGRLREKISSEFFGNDVLSMEKVRKYVQEAAGVLV